MALDVLLCLVGFVLLYFGADWLVKGSSNLARSLGVPSIVIGLTVVAFGTSAPEFVVSVVSSLKAKSMIAVGNVFGSNICNIALVLGLAATLRTITCDRTVVRRDIPIMLVITVVVLALCTNDVLTRVEGTFLFAGLIAYTFMNYAFARRGRLEGVEVPDAEGTGDRLVAWRGVSLVMVSSAVIAFAGFFTGATFVGILGVGMLFVTLVVVGAQEGLRLRAGSRVLLVLLVIAGIYGVVQGAQTVVDSAERIMVALGVGERFIGLTIVALGTSLPELATSIVAAYRNEMDISVGNLVGSNVFNLLGVLGVASMVRPITIPGGFFESGMALDGAVMLFTSALPLFFMRRNASLGRREGLILLACYAGFLAYLIVQA